MQRRRRSRRWMGLAMAMAMRPGCPRRTASRVGHRFRRGRCRARAVARIRRRQLLERPVVGVDDEEIGGCQHVTEGGVILGHDPGRVLPCLRDRRRSAALRPCGRSSSVVAAALGSDYPRAVRAARSLSVFSMSLSTAARKASGASSWSCRRRFGAAPVADATRSASVGAGLSAVPDEATIICVHDAARPLATPDLFLAVVDAVRSGADGAVPAVAVTDTIKTVDVSGLVVRHPDRSTLVAVQTPQVFWAGVLRRARRGGVGTDDAALVERLGGRVVVVPGEAWNRKITEPDDLRFWRPAGGSLAHGVSERGLELRVRSGFDVHRFGDDPRGRWCSAAACSPTCRACRPQRRRRRRSRRRRGAARCSRPRRHGERFPDTDPAFAGAD